MDVRPLFKGRSRFRAALKCDVFSGLEFVRTRLNRTFGDGLNPPKNSILTLDSHSKLHTRPRLVRETYSKKSGFDWLPDPARPTRDVSRALEFSSSSIFEHVNFEYEVFQIKLSSNIIIVNSIVLFSGGSMASKKSASMTTMNQNLLLLWAI